MGKTGRRYSNETKRAAFRCGTHVSSVSSRRGGERGGIEATLVPYCTIPCMIGSVTLYGGKFNASRIALLLYDMTVLYVE